MLSVKVPIEDTALAARRGLTFMVSGRTVKGERWVHENTDVESLQEAMALALAAPWPEVALWVMRKDGRGNMMYWSSASPQLFNSVALQEGYS
jgi:hypothetical protein